MSVFDVQGEQSAERLPALYQQRNTLPIVWEEEGAHCCVLMCLFVCDLINRKTPKGPVQSASLSLWDWLLSVSERGCMHVCESVFEFLFFGDGYNSFRRADLQWRQLYRQTK